MQRKLQNIHVFRDGARLCITAHHTCAPAMHYTRKAWKRGKPIENQGKSHALLTCAPRSPSLPFKYQNLLKKICIYNFINVSYQNSLSPLLNFFAHTDVHINSIIDSQGRNYMTLASCTCTHMLQFFNINIFLQTIAPYQVMHVIFSEGIKWCISSATSFFHVTLCVHR